MKISKTFILISLITTMVVSGSYVALMSPRKTLPPSSDIPTTNLSYLTITSDDKLFPLITNPNGKQTGTPDGKTMLTNIENSNFSQETSLYDSENPGTEEGIPYWNLEIKYPEAGEYTLEFNATKSGDYIFELYFFDRQGNIQTEKQSVSLKANKPTTYKINYSQTGEYPATLLHLD